MPNSRTYYLRSSLRNVIQLEVNTLDKDDSSPNNNEWFQDKHLQEILELLRDTVVAYDTSQSAKKAHSTKQPSLPSGIVTGSSVRFGYVFKHRPAKQFCLVPTNVVPFPSVSGISDDDDLIDFNMLRDKLVVYAHLMTAHSPQKMSQLVKAIGDKRLSSGISVSSYFKRLPSSQTGSSRSQTGSVDSQTQSTSTGPGSQSSLDASDENRNKIKNILQRGKLTKAKGRHVKRQTGTHKLQEKNGTKVTEISSIGKTLTPKESVTTSIQATSDKLTAATVNPSLNNEISNTMDGVKITKVDKSINMFPLEEESSEDNSVTIISIGKVEELSEPEEVDLKTQSDLSEDLKDQDKAVSVTDSSDDNSLPSASFCVKPPKSQTGIADKVPLTFHDIISGEVAGGSPANRRETTNDTVPKTSPDDALSNNDSCVDALTGTEDDGIKFPMIPVLRSKATNNLKTCSDNKGIDVDRLPDSISSATDTAAQVKTVDTLKETEDEEDIKIIKVPLKSTARRRFKRKLPIFSDSDSDEVTMNKKPAKIVDITVNKPDIPDVSGRKRASKKLTISKSFFSDTGKKGQPTLSNFMSKHDKENDDADTASNNADDDLEVELIKEISDMPIVKSERDKELKTEVGSLSSVADLNDEQLNYLVTFNKMYLRNIFQGKIKCTRHEMYKKGGQSRRNLVFESCLSQFTEDQVDIVMASLFSIFCKRHHKYKDYVMKVMLPEMLIRLHMDVHDTSHSESEQQLTQ